MQSNLIFQFILHSRMYQFIGDASGTDSLDFQPLFAEYENNPGTGSKRISNFWIHLTCCCKEILNYVHVLLCNCMLPSATYLFLSPLSAHFLPLFIFFSIPLLMFLSLILLLSFFCLHVHVSPSSLVFSCCLSAHPFVHPCLPHCLFLFLNYIKVYVPLMHNFGVFVTNNFFLLQSWLIWVKNVNVLHLIKICKLGL